MNLQVILLSIIIVFLCINLILAAYQLIVKIKERKRMIKKFKEEKDKNDKRNN